MVLGGSMFWFCQRLVFIRLEVEHDQVDTEVLAGRLRFVIEDVPEMTVTGRADDLGAIHAVARIVPKLGVRTLGGVKTRPSAVRVVPRPRVK